MSKKKPQYTKGKFHRLINILRSSKTLLKEFKNNILKVEYVSRYPAKGGYLFLIFNEEMLEPFDYSKQLNYFAYGKEKNKNRKLLHNRQVKR